MAAGADSSRDPQTPDEIAGGIEQTREELAHTIDALVERTSPRTIARRTLDGVKARFFTPSGSPQVGAFAAAGAVAAGVVVVVVVLRRVVGAR